MLRALRRKLPRKGPRRPVPVWTTDEGRFGLHPCHRCAGAGGRGAGAPAALQPRPRGIGAQRRLTAGRQPEGRRRSLSQRLWDMLRDELCNRTWKGLDGLMAAATRWLERFWSDGRRVLLLVGDEWLLVQANACSGSCLGS